MTRVPAIRDDTGLCAYSDPDPLWFGTAKTRPAKTAAAICANCPAIISCAEKALTLGVTDGVWAGVTMPGPASNDDLTRARHELRQVIERYRHQPAELRRRALAIRQAMHYAAVQRHKRARLTPKPQNNLAPGMEKAGA